MMTQNKKRIGRLLRLILPMVLLAVIIFPMHRCFTSGQW